MRRGSRHVVDRFEELFDRDIETLLDGGSPSNTDLIPLCVVVDELRSLADAPLPPGFIDFHAAEAAATIEKLRSQAPTHRRNDRRAGLVVAIRRRATAAAATLVMLVSATGMAWAADTAVPGDWFYGIDRALEQIGIGAGGDAERLQELEATTTEMPAERESTQLLEPETSSALAPERSTGLDRAANALRQDRRSGFAPTETPGPPVDMLGYLQSTDHVDGAVVAGLAKGDRVQPDTPGESRGVGRPDADRQSSDNNGAASRGRPETPGKSERSSRP